MDQEKCFNADTLRHFTKNLVLQAGLVRRAETSRLKSKNDSAEIFCQMIENRKAENMILGWKIIALYWRFIIF